MKIIFTWEKLLDLFLLLLLLLYKLIPNHFSFFLPSFFFQFWMFFNSWFHCFKTEFTVIIKMWNNLKIKGFFEDTLSPYQNSINLLLCVTIFSLDFHLCQHKATTLMSHLHPPPICNPATGHRHPGFSRVSNGRACILLFSVCQIMLNSS